jgi:hypothetical protein
MIALSLCTAGVLFCLWTPASAALQVLPTAIVTEVRAYADGNVHVTLSVNTACSGVGRMNVLRVGGAGADRVLSAALAALLAGHEVEVEYDDARSGNYCNLSYLRIK